MPSSMNPMSMTGAVADLGLGSNLSDQVKDQTEEEKRKRRLGLSTLQSPAAQMLLGGMTGMRSVNGL